VTEEIKDGVIECILVLDRRKVTDAWKDNEFRFRDALCDEFSLLQRCHTVFLSPQDEGRRRQTGERR
jgi:hypothetical protein